MYDSGCGNPTKIIKSSIWLTFSLVFFFHYSEPFWKYFLKQMTLIYETKSCIKQSTFVLIWREQKDIRIDNDEFCFYFGFNWNHLFFFRWKIGIIFVIGLISLLSWLKSFLFGSIVRLFLRLHSKRIQFQNYPQFF